MKGKFTILISAILILTFALCGCSSYVSSYKATVLVHSNDRNSASMSFSSFEGTMVFKLKADDASHLSANARLASGSAKVYYDDGSGKKELFTLDSKSEQELTSPELDSGTVYVIIKSDGKCEEGKLDFEINR